MEQLSRDELLKQYDRFIDQVRTEIKDLYWLYNFFFLVDSALLGSIFFGKINTHYIIVVELLGVLLSLYWYGILRKQRMWRDEWVRKIQHVEQLLGYTDTNIQLWRVKTRSDKIWYQYITGKSGLWRWLILLPIGFMIIWIILYLVQ